MPSSTLSRSSVTRVALLAAVIAPAVFIPLDMVDALLRPDYSFTRHWVSHLALGRWGWIGTIVLATTTVLCAAGALGLLFALRRARGRIAAAVSALIASAGLAIATAFPMDPSLGFPAGATEGVANVPGLIHQIAGPVFIVGLAIALLTSPRSLRSIGGPVTSGAFRAAGIASLAIFVLCSVLVSLDYAQVWPAAPSGLAERLAIYIGLVGVAVLAFRVRRHGTQLSA